MDLSIRLCGSTRYGKAVSKQAGELMRSARKFIPAAAIAALLTVSGCSEDEPTAQASPSEKASPSELAHYTAAPDPTAPTQSPTTAAPTECVKTAGMSVEKLTAYLKELPSSSGAYQSRGLTLDSSGLNFTPEAIQRPCKAVTVKLARYWVELEKTMEATPVSPARYEYQYTPIDVTSHKAGPQDGRIPDTAPPGGSDCQGSLSVLYLGEDIPLQSLPSDLELTDTTAPVPVEVAGDGVLSALYVSPISVVSC
ncbi:hypothetical protein [Streptomyces sp. ID05-47C]|uniref:hypothetical protein n=1 Tax=Streptomyces sp. ID05-47C TaxID=3028665 RepID=UPI0029B3B38B|nr:hypothetical protein [Streptomyces sp. ID05-47C]MDX3571022.1 hypothetical protein [Streptomyces sp. ID05-47C]